MNTVADYSADEFPAGMKVLVVDDDSTCLAVMERMLRKFSYEATKCQNAKDALALLREDKNRFDIVLCDLHMPDMDGFKLSEIIVSEMDLPVVIWSADERQPNIMKGIMKGACDYLVKPVRMDAIRLLWQHVVRKRKRDFQHPAGIENININVNKQLEHTNDASDNQTVPIVDKSRPQCPKRTYEESSNERESSDYATTVKKPRVVWSQELHDLFVAAVDQLGRDKAVPKKILERMQAVDVTASCLTRANIASHLQKYRMHLHKGVARSNGTNKNQLNAYFNHHNLQFQPTLPASYQVQSQNHVDRGTNMFDSNIVRTDVSLYDLSPSNLLYQNDFPQSDHHVPISNELNSYGNVGNGTESFSGSDELMIYEPSFWVEQYVQDFVRGPF